MNDTLKIIIYYCLTTLFILIIPLIILVSRYKKMTQTNKKTDAILNVCIWYLADFLIYVISLSILYIIFYAYDWRWAESNIIIVVLTSLPTLFIIAFYIIGLCIFCLKIFILIKAKNIIPQLLAKLKSKLKRNFTSQK